MQAETIPPAPVAPVSARPIPARITAATPPEILAAVLGVDLAELARLYPLPGYRADRPAPCGRCGGGGYGPWRQDGGVCYECGGANTRQRTIPASALSDARRVAASMRASRRARAKADAARAVAAAWIAERPALAAALALGHAQGDRFLGEMAERAALDPLTPAQEAAALAAADRIRAKAERPGAPTGGPVDITGTVETARERHNDYTGETDTELIIRTDAGWEARVNAPAAMFRRWREETEQSRAEFKTWAKGGRISLRVSTVNPWAKMPSVGFCKRPTRLQFTANPAPTPAPTE